LKDASSEPDVELILHFSDKQAELLHKAIHDTQWVELPFQQAVLHLESAWSRHKLNGSVHILGRDGFFTSAFILQSTDGHRWNLPMTKMLGLLMAWEYQRDYEGRGQAWFETSIRDLFVVMKGLPHEHDSAFLDLLRAMQPGLDQLISSIAHKGADATHKRNRKHKAEAQAEWEANGCGPIADFARRRHGAYFVTERTLGVWLGEHKKNLNR
jgi:hypothetical protein